MKLERSFFRSKVAQRIFALFVVCALFPIGALAFLSFTEVTGQLHEQSHRRLRQASKALALGIYERLLFLESEMKTISSLFIHDGTSRLREPPQGIREELERRFSGLAIMGPGSEQKILLGDVRQPPTLDEEEEQHIMSGKTLITVRHPSGSAPKLFAMMALDPERPAAGMLLAEIHPQYVWGAKEEDRLPPMTEMCVLETSGTVLNCSHPTPPSFLKELERATTRSTSGQFEWKGTDADFLAGFWAIPLKYRFFLGQWTVVLSQSKDSAFAPIANFRKVFPLVILASLFGVILLSVSQIRRHLVPLEKLQEGTRRIAARDFRSRVTVKSGDEFEDLAESFNRMANQLGNQFTTLVSIAEIDRAILSALDTEKILDAVLARIGDLFPCDHSSITLFGAGNEVTASSYLRGENGRIVVKEIPFSSEMVRESLRGGLESGLLLEKQDAHSLAPLFENGIQALLLLPLFIKERPCGVIALGYLNPPDEGRIDLLQARQLADQVAVAIHNSQLYEETRSQAIALERSNRVKDEFLSVMSHELRTPLTVLMGYCEMIREGFLGEINPKQEKAMDLVQKRSKDLLGMINTIMQVTQIESGATVVERQDIHLNDFLDYLKSAQIPPSDKEITIKWDYPEDLPVVKLDGGKLRDVLQNLIDNAIKFSNQGEVAITARYLPGLKRLEFKVADTGIGIAKEALGFIFEKFRQLDSSERRSYGGAGLGLFIAKRFTELLGGTIHVESEPGKGCTFTVIIPC